MKSKALIFSVLLIVSVFAGLAQQMETKWTEKMVYDNKIDGFFKAFVGNNSQYVYAKFSNLAFRPNKQDKKIKIIALNKNTLVKEGELRLTGYPQNKGTSDMDFYKIIALENVVYVVWTKDEKNALDVYLETYDPKLNKLSKLKKVYTLKDDRKKSEKLVLVHNNKAGSIIMLGKELGIEEKEEALKFEYNIISQNLEVKSSGVVELPIVVRRSGVSSDPLGGPSVNYELGDNGKIYVTDYIKRDKKEVKKGESSYYPIIVQINPSNGKSKSFNLRFENKNTFRFSTLITKDGIALYGFFSDLDKDPRGNDTHGIFYVSMDETEFKVKSNRFSYFDKAFLDQLFASDKEDQRKSFKLNKDKKKSDEESIDNRYVIESVQQEGKDIILFCSMMYNWERTVCSTSSNGAQTCRTYYYCDKSNVTAFRISAEGGLVWASNLDRFYRYNTWNVYDVETIKSGNTYYVVYNSMFQAGAKKKNKSSKKSKEQLNDRFEYAAFDATTGKYTRQECQVNAVNTPKKEKKFVSATRLTVYDNKFFTYSERTKIKPLSYLFCLLLPIGPYYVAYSGNTRRGEGYLGTISATR